MTNPTTTDTTDTGQTTATKADYFVEPAGSLGEPVDNALTTNTDTDGTDTTDDGSVLQTPMVQYAMGIINQAAGIASELRSDEAKAAVAGGEDIRGTYYGSVQDKVSDMIGTLNNELFSSTITTLIATIDGDDTDCGILIHLPANATIVSKQSRVIQSFIADITAKYADIRRYSVERLFWSKLVDLVKARIATDVVVNVEGTTRTITQIINVSLAGVLSAYAVYDYGRTNAYFKNIEGISNYLTNGDIRQAGGFKNAVNLVDTGDAVQLNYGLNGIKNACGYAMLFSFHMDYDGWVKETLALDVPDASEVAEPVADAETGDTGVEDAVVVSDT